MVKDGATWIVQNSKDVNVLVKHVEKYPLETDSFSIYEVTDTFDFKCRISNPGLANLKPLDLAKLQAAAAPAAAPVKSATPAAAPPAAATGPAMYMLCFTMTKDQVPWIVTHSSKPADILAHIKKYPLEMDSFKAYKVTDVAFDFSKRVGPSLKGLTALSLEQLAAESPSNASTSTTATAKAKAKPSTAKAKPATVKSSKAAGKAKQMGKSCTSALVGYSPEGLLKWKGGEESFAEVALFITDVETCIQEGGMVSQGVHDRYIARCSSANRRVLNIVNAASLPHPLISENGMMKVSSTFKAALSSLSLAEQDRFLTGVKEVVASGALQMSQVCR
jgi:hypothetical protein